MVNQEISVEELHELFRWEKLFVRNAVSAGSIRNCGNFEMELSLYIDIESSQLPIIYRKEYNVNFGGLERCHPFDARKWGKVYKHLKEAGVVTDEKVVRPVEAKREHLLFVHSKKYLRQLKCSINVAWITEVVPLMFVPNFIIQKCYLKKMRFQVGGSILAGKLALERGYAINIGGGFHHCSSDRGGGFCPYADITLLIKYVLEYFPENVRKVMIVDLDAHQGNGYARDFINNENIYIMDVFNRQIYPNDVYAKQAVNRCVELLANTGDDLFLKVVEENLDIAMGQFRPDLVVYNAGTDILKGDPLGHLCITAEGIIKRDELIFRKVRELKIPIVMLTSGGYLRQTARIIADSIINLYQLGLIKAPPEKI